MRLDGQGELTLDEVARRAGIERRTIFRHFATKESLLETFWAWINERVIPRTLPGPLEELVAGPRETFARFDDFEGVIRSSLHSPTGRAMRMAARTPPGVPHGSPGGDARSRRRGSAPPRGRRALPLQRRRLGDSARLRRRHRGRGRRRRVVSDRRPRRSRALPHVGGLLDREAADEAQFHPTGIPRATLPRK